MATADPEFVAYMRTQNFTADDATDVAEKLSVAGLYSASDFLVFYTTKGTDMYRWWPQNPNPIFKITISFTKTPKNQNTFEKRKCSKTTKIRKFILYYV